MLKSHTLVPEVEFKDIRYELRPAVDPSGDMVEGLFNAWIILDNPGQYNSYTTEAVKEVILAFRQASMDRSVVCCVFTAVGDKAFCTGGNTKEYAEYYAGNPQEYKQYMRLFNDMIDAILRCDKPVLNRVNGMRIAGGQEIGMACDFSVSVDTAVFGQAGPRHESAPDGGSTDFLPLYVGFSRAMESATLCDMWSAHKALFYGLINQVVPALKVDGEWIPNPMVVTDRFVDPFGNLVFGDFKVGEEKGKAKDVLARLETDLARLDEVHVEVVEGFRVLAQRVRERRTLFDVALDLANDRLEGLVRLLFGEDVETLNEREACVDHRGELSREDDEVASRDPFLQEREILADVLGASLDGHR